jgi:hypothetical protein
MRQRLVDRDEINTFEQRMRSLFVWRWPLISQKIIGGRRQRLRAIQPHL